MVNVKNMFGTKEEEEDNIVAEINQASTLSWSTRIKCFLVCFIIGVTCSILHLSTHEQRENKDYISKFAGTFLLWKSLRLFAALYTMGNIASICSTLFLMGPVKQLRNMFKEKRLIATIIMLLSLVLTLCAAFWWKNKALALLFCIIQYLAMTWYCLSYIPFARDAVKKMFNACLS